MPYYVDNLSWMSFNTILAFVPIVLVVILRRKLSPFVHYLFLFLWLIFLPNTIYLITDLQHMPPQLLRSSMGEQVILIFQYVTLAVLGVMTYVYSLEPVSTILKKLHLTYKSQDYLYILLNYIVAFGVMMGKVQRTHSWYVFTDPIRVIRDGITTLTTGELVLWVIFIGTIINFLFFLFRDYFPPLRRAHKKR